MFSDPRQTFQPAQLMNFQFISLLFFCLVRYCRLIWLLSVEHIVSHHPRVICLTDRQKIVANCWSVRSGTHWRQSWIRDGRLCSTKSAVSLWPHTHWETKLKGHLTFRAIFRKQKSSTFDKVDQVGDNVDRDKLCRLSTFLIVSTFDFVASVYWP